MLMKKILQSTWMVSLVGCIVYLATTAVVLSSAKFEAIASDDELVSANDDPSWRFRNPEFEQWVQDLQRERADVETRKGQLKELETRLQAERQELNVVLQRCTQVQAEFEKNVVRLRDQELKNIKKQAKVMADMTPESAAALLVQMPDDDSARMLAVMKSEQATVLLEVISKMGSDQLKHAAIIAERMKHILPDNASTNSAPSPL
jgi:flagellar motility protein MotE (MotC chaperone)